MSFLNKVWVGENRNYLIAILFASLAASIPLPRNYSTVLTILLFLIGISTVKKPWKYSVLFRYYLPFILVQIVGLLWTTNYEEAVSNMERMLPIILIPLIFSLVPGGLEKIAHYSRLSFIAISFILLSYSLVAAGLSYRGLYEYKIFFYHDLANQVGLSALYLSLYFVFSIALIFDLWLSGYLNARLKNATICLVLFFVLGAILMASRISLIALFILFVFSIIYYRKNARIALLRTGFLISVLLVTAAVMFIPILTERLKEAINRNNNFSFELVGGGTSFRWAKWESGTKLIQQQPLFGFGTGDVQDVLDAQYVKDGHPQLLHYDVHNQYFQTFIAQGLLGFICLIVLLLAPILSGNRSYLTYCFVLIFSVSILTESMLEVQKGVIFFAFFSSLLAFQGQNKTEVGFT